LQSGDLVEALYADGESRVTLHLGEQIGSGRTARVHRAVAADDSAPYAVKLYHQDPPSELAARLVDLHRHFLLPDLSGLSPRSPAAAVPLATVNVDGRAVGVVMPLLDRYFTQKDFEGLNASSDAAFMLTLSRSLVADLANLHHAGFVIGDLGDPNILIAPSGALVWLDCDAWGTERVDATHFYPGFARAAQVAGAPADAESDRFAMAIHLARFLSLRMLHPYAFEYAQDLCPALQTRIDRGHCWLLDPHGFAAAPDLGLELYPEVIRDLLRRTFLHDDPGSLWEWQVALDQVEVTTCAWCGSGAYVGSACAECHRQVERPEPAPTHAAPTGPEEPDEAAEEVDKEVEQELDEVAAQAPRESSSQASARRRGSEDVAEGAVIAVGIVLFLLVLLSLLTHFLS
jgi:DNA-binding helix-hairpin-helix protein with protein kinase domain